VVVACAIGLAAGFLVAAGRRWGVVALLVLTVGAFHLEIDQVDRFVARTYEAQAVPGQRAAIDQSLADGRLSSARVRITPPCPTRRVAFAFSDEPAPVVIDEGGTLVTGVVPEVVRPDAVYTIGHYRLPKATSRPFTVVFPAASLLNVTRHDMTPRLSLVGHRGDPVARVYCATRGNGAEERFAEVFGPDHDGVHPYHLVRGWPRAWFLASLVALVAALAWATGRLRLERPGRRGDDVAT
jgi:hypothetical protein